MGSSTERGGGDRLSEREGKKGSQERKGERKSDEREDGVSNPRDDCNPFKEGKCSSIHYVNDNSDIIRVYVGPINPTSWGKRNTRTSSPSPAYVLGFHPHGILPATLGWLQRSSIWETLFTNLYKDQQKYGSMRAQQNSYVTLQDPHHAHHHHQQQHKENNKHKERRERTL